MATLLKAFYANYRYLFDEVVDEATNEFFLMDSIFYPIAIVAVYLYFVNHVGPRFMEKRPAYNIDKLVTAYNFTQVIVSLYLFHYGTTVGWGTRLNYYCAPIDRSDPEYFRYLIKGGWMYFIVKIVDLLDTVFFILRKNQRQVTFLHVYHHAGMIICTWLFMKFYPGGDGALIPFMNSFVHAIMYTYYLITSMWPEYKKSIWWKKHITQLQMLQFTIVGLHAIPPLVMKDCNYPQGAAFFTLIQSIVVFSMFFNFYITAYWKKTKST